MSTPLLENWGVQVRKGVLELCVLTVIAAGRQYGYEVVKRLGAIRGLGISEGTIYPLLSRLRRDGLVETTLEESVEGPARKYYRLTAAGRDHLRGMSHHWGELVKGVATLKQERN